MADMIGFIGVGTMGEPMCRNLARKSGLEIFAADRDPAPLKRLAADGVKAASLDEIAASCRTILLSLPGGKEVEQVCLGEGGLIAKAVLGWRPRVGMDEALDRFCAYARERVVNA